MRKKNVPIPDTLIKLRSLFNQKRLYDALFLMRQIKGVNVSYGNPITASYWYTHFKVVFDQNSPNNYKILNDDSHFTPDICFATAWKHVYKFVYFDSDAKAYCADANFECKSEYNYSKKTSTFSAFAVRLGEWTYCDKMISNYLLVNSESDTENILKATNPYGFECCEKYNIPCSDMLIFPALEQLAKAGYKFYSNINEEAKLQKFNRLCKKGTNIKEIFKCSKAVYTVLKEETDIDVWEYFRKMDKTGRIHKEDIQRTYDANYNAQEIRLIYDILGMKHNNNPVFTFDSLQRYLERLDMNEALVGKEALQYIRDYVMMCGTLGVKPRLDSDSLRREHDVTARIIRLERNRVDNEKMKVVCNQLSKYDYKEDIFFVRTIKDYDDLVDEARQQGNCVAGYANSIIRGKSKIFVMRENSRPGKSLITIEIDDSGNIRQALLSHNRAIRNKAQSEFIKRWTSHVKKLMRTA